MVENRTYLMVRRYPSAAQRSTRIEERGDDASKDAAQTRLVGKKKGGTASRPPEVLFQVEERAGPEKSLLPSVSVGDADAGAEVPAGRSFEPHVKATEAIRDVGEVSHSRFVGVDGGQLSVGRSSEDMTSLA